MTHRSDSRFWDKIAEKYAKNPVANPEAYQRKLAMTQAYLDPEMILLEVGCGTGSTALAHAPYVRHILATDLSGEMIRIAQDKAKAAGIDNVRFATAGLDGLDDAPGAYDAVLALSLLHLVKDSDAAIARLAGLLKPGGLFVSNTACLGDSMAWLAPILPIGRLLGVFPMVRVLRAKALQASLGRHGFEILERYQPDRRTLFLIARKTV